MSILESTYHQFLLSPSLKFPQRSSLGSDMKFGMEGNDVCSYQNDLDFDPRLTDFVMGGEVIWLKTIDLERNEKARTIEKRKTVDCSYLVLTLKDEVGTVIRSS